MIYPPAAREVVDTDDELRAARADVSLRYGRCRSVAVETADSRAVRFATAAAQLADAGTSSSELEEYAGQPCSTYADVPVGLGSPSEMPMN